MESKLGFLFDIGIILLAANIGGIISKKLKQPVVLGQILVGLILGMGILEKTETVSQLAEIGVVFLMFIAGLETDVNELKASGRSSSLIALGGVLIPFILVFAGMYIVTSNFLASLFMGVIATATSVSISVQTLREIDQMRSRQGIGILGAAIIDDVVGIILLTLIIGVVRPGENNNVFLVIGKIGIFFIMTFIIGYLLIRIMSKISTKINIDDKIVSFAIVFCFILAFLSEELGVAAITGAYFSGVVFSMTSCRHKLSHEVHRISSIIFTPIFFVAIGLGVDLRAAISALGIGIILVVLGALGKIIGCGFGAKISGFGNKEALQIGFGMVPRAEVAIIIANLGLAINVINEKQLASVIMMVLITTLITPSLLKWSFGRA